MNLNTDFVSMGMFVCVLVFLQMIMGLRMLEGKFKNLHMQLPWLILEIPKSKWN